METTRKLCNISFMRLLSERCLAWLYEVKRFFVRSDEWKSHLVEYYCIYPTMLSDGNVREWLDKRKRILRDNRYRMIVKKISEKEKLPADGLTVGYVLLYSRGHFIHQATLKMRPGADEARAADRIIYWSFEKQPS